jgi:hypothetical protein
MGEYRRRGLSLGPEHSNAPQDFGMTFEAVKISTVGSGPLIRSNRRNGSLEKTCSYERTLPRGQGAKAMRSARDRRHLARVCYE